MPHIPAYQPTCLLCGREGAAALTPGPMLRCVHCNGSMAWESCFESANVLGLVKLAVLEKWALCKCEKCHRPLRTQVSIDRGRCGGCTDQQRERRAYHQEYSQQHRERAPYVGLTRQERREHAQQPEIQCRGCGMSLRQKNSRERGTCSWCNEADTRTEQRAYTRPRRNDHAASL